MSYTPPQTITLSLGHPAKVDIDKFDKWLIIFNGRQSAASALEFTIICLYRNSITTYPIFVPYPSEVGFYIEPLRATFKVKTLADNLSYVVLDEVPKVEGKK